VRRTREPALSEVEGSADFDLDFALVLGCLALPDQPELADKSVRPTQIIAQALSEKIPVVTSDEKFSLYKGLKIIW
jgi:PIN domain nuclease of toxin-antitoxin system